MHVRGSSSTLKTLYVLRRREDVRVILPTNKKEKGGNLKGKITSSKNEVEIIYVPIAREKLLGGEVLDISFSH